MTLLQFYRAVWTPFRQLEHPATWAREDASRWPHILRHLGTVRLRDLDRRRWVGFLRSMSTRWGNHAQRLAQNEYKLLLRCAQEEGAIDTVHLMPKISRKRKREPKPLLPEEVLGIIGCATDLLHMALFALAFGQGWARILRRRTGWADSAVVHHRRFGSLGVVPLHAVPRAVRSSDIAHRMPGSSPASVRATTDTSRTRRA